MIPDKNYECSSSNATHYIQLPHIEKNKTDELRETNCISCELVDHGIDFQITYTREFSRFELK